MKPFLPPGVRIGKEKVWRSAWKMEGEYLSVKSKKFDASIEGDDWAALVFCVRTAWSCWKKLSGEECPYELP